MSLILDWAVNTCRLISITADRTQKTYRELKQPPLSPQPYVFGPVWTILYASMGYAAYRAWNSAGASFDGHQAALAKVLFA
jgi:benzodiazapine receptor